MHLPASRSSLVLVGLLFGVALVACKDPIKGESSSSGTPPPASASSAAATSAAATASAASTALAGGPDGALVVTWKVATADLPAVSVSAVVGSETIPLGKLDATGEDRESGVGTCAMRSTTATSTSFWCGDTPAFNYVTAKLTGGALVFSLTKGVSTGGVDDSQETKEILRRPTTATALRVTGPAPAGLNGNCRPGYVQRTAESICMRQCLKGNECTGNTKCEFVAVKGTDGDHKVHACVPQKH